MSRGVMHWRLCSRDSGGARGVAWRRLQQRQDVRRRRSLQAPHSEGFPGHPLLCCHSTVYRSCLFGLSVPILTVCSMGHVMFTAGGTAYSRCLVTALWNGRMNELPMGTERRGHGHSRDIRHWALSIGGLWVDKLHAFTVALLLEGHGHTLGPLHTTQDGFADLGAQVTFWKMLGGVRNGSHPLPDGGIPRKRHPEMAEWMTGELSRSDLRV